MRILHVIASLDAATGGPPVVAAALASAQAALGHDVHLASYPLPPGATPAGPSDFRAHALPPTDVVERIWPRRATRWFADFLRSATSAAKGADILHLHGVWEPVIPAAARTARAAGVPYVVAPHGMLDPWSMRQKALKKHVALALGYHGLLDRAAFLHALNADEADLIAPLGLRCPFEVIPNGVPPETFADLPAPGAFRRDRPELGSDPYVLFLGRLHHKKGLDHLADAFARLAPRFPAARLVIAGPDGGEREPFERQIRAAGLADRVHVVGPLYGPDKLAALVDATAFCLPSRQEGFSVAVTEAMACGLPVVISDACHFPEVADAGAGIITPADGVATAEALARLLSDPDLRQRMGRAGREMVLSRYTWPRIAQAAVAAYLRRGAGGT